ncbi:hypothetical protein M9H77_35931 [Catharanthus roseus]|uniref:Uncharacterized protein n=1 Tax=Catharanthus roseus TaxID=4058 RepID=A0ACB9ZQD3_CATRO|nr:hypothetical protein M9H77_35931 [Catharanthus roseus]
MSFIDEFQANLEVLPNILQKKYALLRDLDKSLQEIQRQNEHRCEQEMDEMKQRIKSGSVSTDSSLIRFSDDALDEQKHAVRIADEKVALAVHAYDLVDTHIQQLDQYMKKLDEEIRREKDSTTSTASPASALDSNVKSGRSGEGGRGGRKKTRLSAAAAASAASTAATNPSGMDLDLPVDPNEPTYCTCNQVSFGEMIACDNPGVRISNCIPFNNFISFDFNIPLHITKLVLAQCKIEWFHIGCVGLKESPKGNWYCPDCIGTQRRWKGK